MAHLVQNPALTVTNQMPVSNLQAGPEQKNTLPSYKAKKDQGKNAGIWSWRENTSQRESKAEKESYMTQSFFRILQCQITHTLDKFCMLKHHSLEPWIIFIFWNSVLLSKNLLGVFINSPSCSKTNLDTADRINGEATSQHSVATWMSCPSFRQSFWNECLQTTVSCNEEISTSQLQANWSAVGGGTLNTPKPHTKGNYNDWDWFLEI